MIAEHEFEIVLSTNETILVSVTAELGMEDYGWDADGNRGVRQFYVDDIEFEIPKDLTSELQKELNHKVQLELDNFDWVAKYDERNSYDYL